MHVPTIVSVHEHARKVQNLDAKNFRNIVQKQ